MTHRTDAYRDKQLVEALATAEYWKEMYQTVYDENERLEVGTSTDRLYIMQLEGDKEKL